MRRSVIFFRKRIAIDAEDLCGADLVAASLFQRQLD